MRGAEPSGMQRMMWVAGLTNVFGILFFTRGFTHRAFFELFPEVFGAFGCACVVLWGLAYIAAAARAAELPWLMRLFALEKAVYVVSWAYWVACYGASLPQLWSSDPCSAFFFTFYGLIDLFFGLFFLRISARF